ncbi:26S proteasome non-ATPase regulatory subunit 5 [Paramormyrops kingsleyae]|uniref:26S proteasome non-ATPase regulatory subunit 5 n=1 Tax=Paramormyrops kingsleyae TaxID=1676925 RepID=A0A3B3RK07_9TELE|nr:26S proteasome non-ATPase regulatory subunit 5 [Paramormyrops kingsleyae]
MAASIESLLSELSGLENPIEELKILRTVVLATPLETLKETVPSLQLEVIFSLLNTNDREQTELCVIILGRILQALDPVHLAQNCRNELQAGLNHSDDSVKALAISQVVRIVEHTQAVTEILNSQDLLKTVIHNIGGEKISVAKEAIQALSKLTLTKVGLDALFQSSLLEHLKDVMAMNDVVRYRVYELVVDVASVSPISLGYCANASFISQLLAELTGDDVLVRATAIEMVTTLAQSQHGRQYLEQQGIMEKISNMVIGAESDPFSSFYLPGLVKFFGNLTVMESPQQICECYPAFLRKVFEMTVDQDPVMVGVALDTLGVVGSTVEGKQVLHKTGVEFQRVLKQMSQLVRNAPTDLRVRCLEALTLLLSLPAEQQTEDLLGLTESWFDSLSNQPMHMFQSISSQPFPELHIGALHIFTAIAGQLWGQKLMMATPGFVEFIVDRSTGPSKEMKDAKFELVKALANSASTAEIFGNQNYLRLRTYMREGPYYVTAVSSVTVEGAD